MTDDARTSIRLRIKRLDPRAITPEIKSAGASGMDLAACLDAPVTLEPGEIRLIPTGLAMAIPAGFEGQVRPRSGLACKHGVTVVNAPGTIDSDYRGEIRVGLINLSREPLAIAPGTRIAQIVIAPVMSCAIEEAEELGETERGAGGFGSTGL